MAEVLDDLLRSLGTGKWNILTFIAVAYWFNVIVYHALGGAFLTPDTKYECVVPEGGEHSYDSENETHKCFYIAEGSGDTKHCHEWYYDNTTFGYTITSEFNLVCERTYLRAIYTSVYMFGSFIASPIGGILADKYGRKFIFTIGSVSYFCLSVISCWLPDITSILIFRFLMGVMHTPTMNAGYILGMEVCTPSMRSVVGVLVALPWAIGTILWGGFAYLIRQWRWLQFTITMPTILLLPALWFMDESPRWLAVRGHHEKALKIFKKAARWNGTSLPPDDEIRRLMRLTQSQAHSTSEEVTLPDSSKFRIVLEKLKKCALELIILFRTPRLRLITLIVWLDFLLSSTVFYGLSLNAVNFSADPYVYMMLSGLMEIPAYLMTPTLAAHVGRKIPTISGFTITGVCLLVLPFIDTNTSWLVMPLAMIGKFALSSSFQLLFLYSAELFPTEVRLQGFGSGIFVSRVGGIVAPLITELMGSSYAWSPSVLFGVFSALTGLVTLILPETLNKPLPDTIADLENAHGTRRQGRCDDEVQEMGRLTCEN